MVLWLELCDRVLDPDLLEQVGESIGFYNLSPELLHVDIKLRCSLARNFVELPLLFYALLVHLFSPLNVFHLLLVDLYGIACQKFGHGIRLGNALIV